MAGYGRRAGRYVRDLVSEPAQIPGLPAPGEGGRQVLAAYDAIAPEENDFASEFSGDQPAPAPKESPYQTPPPQIGQRQDIVTRVPDGEPARDPRRRGIPPIGGNVAKSVGTRPEELEGLKSRGFQSSSDPWNSVEQGGAQMETDLAAHDLINRRHAQAIGEIDAQDAERGDPMQKQIQAAAQSRAYARQQPLGEKSHIYASEGDTSGGYLGDKEYGGATEDNQFGATLGEAQDQAQAQAQARAKQDPINSQRAELVNALKNAENYINAQIQNGEISPERGKAMIAFARENAQRLADLGKSGYPPFGTGSDFTEIPTAPAK